MRSSPDKTKFCYSTSRVAPEESTCTPITCESYVDAEMAHAISKEKAQCSRLVPKKGL